MKRLCLIMAIGLSLLGLAPNKVNAQTVNDFVINNFAGRYQLFNDTPGGRVVVTETIDLTFSAQNHGILRALPQKYENQDLGLKVSSVRRDNNQEPYTTYKENDNLVLKIGSASKTITGKHSYEIKYEMTNIIRFYDYGGEFFWDINGDQWQQPFTKVSAEVIAPFKRAGPETKCFTGSFGATANDCQVESIAGGERITTTHTLRSGETLSVVVGFDKTVFEPRTWQDWVKENIFNLGGIVAGLAGVVYVLGIWRKYGKDYEGKGTIIPEYEPPKGLRPAEVGLLYDYRLDTRDVSATVIDLAVRGWIRIHDDEKKTFGIFKKREFSLELVKVDTTKLESHEIKVLHALFSDMKAGNKKTLGAQNSALARTQQTLHKELTDRLTDKFGMIEKSPNKQLLWLGAALVAIFFSLFFITIGWGWVLGRVLVLVAILSVMPFMQRRSHAGVEAYEKVQGLRLYLNTAEKDRLEKLQSVSSPYAAPAPTVKLFEKLLPYAVALGVEKSWAKQFENLYTQPPGWYTGNNMHAFNTAYLASSLTSTVSAMNTSFTAPSSSGGSGFSGGGSAGGGGGGGGGGGW